MEWVTIVWSMIFTTCVALGSIYLLVVLKKRSEWWQLLFVVTAFSIAAMSVFEYLSFHSSTTDEFGKIYRLALVPYGIMFVGGMWFTREYLKAGPLWLAIAATAGRALALILNFVLTPNISFREITELYKLPFLGGAIAVPIGIPNPWGIIGQVSSVLVLAFCIVATVKAWRRGDRQKAILVGGSMATFVCLTVLVGTVVIWLKLPVPFISSLMFVGVILAMAFQLSDDVVRSGRLSEQEKQMKLAVEAAGLGIWIRDLRTETSWGSDRCKDLFEFERVEPYDLDELVARVHPQDREILLNGLNRAIETKGIYAAQYRIRLRDGNIRWISSYGRIECNDAGKPMLLRGVSLDITDQKATEQIALELSGRLLRAHEDERSRVARELHDDLSQQIAYLAIRLETIATDEAIKSQLRELTPSVKKLATTVHRISHELHPATLKQLGLEIAVNSFCEETMSAHGLDVEFTSENVPDHVPDNVALCLYRIAQEGLQNTIRHSGSPSAAVDLSADGNGILTLTVSDKGSGFDTEAARHKHSLGIVSMRERVRSVNGTLSISSAPNHGTTIRVTVPTNGNGS